MKKTCLIVLALAVPLLACGPEEAVVVTSTGGTASTGAGLSSRTYKYTCYAYGSSRLVDSFTLKLSGTHATLVTTDGTSKGTYNSSYHPTSTSHKNKAQFRNFVSSTNAAGKASGLVPDYALVDKSMRTGGVALQSGGTGGFAELILSESGYSSYRFVCRR